MPNLLGFVTQRPQVPREAVTRKALEPSLALEARNGAGWTAMSRESAPAAYPGRTYRLVVSPTGGGTTIPAEENVTLRVVHVRGVAEKALQTLSRQQASASFPIPLDGVGYDASSAFRLDRLTGGEWVQVDRVPASPRVAATTHQTAITADLQQRSAKGSATLDIVEPSQNEFSFQLYIAAEQPTNAKPSDCTARFDVRPEGLSLFIQNGKLQANNWFSYLEHLRKNDLAKLVSLIEDGLDAHHAGTLVIRDNSGLAFPWEMLQLRDGSYLGARIALVRWLQNEYVTWEDDTAATCDGGVIAYVEADAPGVAAWKHTLAAAGLKARPLEDFAAVDAEQVKGVALVHVHSHVYFEGTEHTIKIGPLGFFSIAASAIEDEPRPVVFVSGCQSARIRRGPNGPVGLPQRFLQQIARAYVGTVTPIQGQFSSEFGKILLDRARTKLHADGVCIPDLLLEMRKEMARAEREAQSKERTAVREKMVDVFSVVYFGNPYLRLKLANA